MSWLHALILSIVEGITEYLPVSSTGHLIITSAIMGINEEPFVKGFNIIVQFGAILSVVVLYWRRLIAPPAFYIKILVGIIPAGVLGILLKDKIDAVLGNVEIVGAALFIGGIILIFVDRRSEKYATGKTVQSLSYRDAFMIGLCQCFAFIPGVSRSAASILGGLYFGLSRREAAEFSFFLAVPTLAGATLLKTLKIWPTITHDQMNILIFGNIISFIIGCLAIKTFIDFLSRRGFFVFGVYRVIVGFAVFAMIYGGIHLVNN